MYYIHEDTRLCAHINNFIHKHIYIQCTNTFVYNAHIYMRASIYIYIYVCSNEYLYVYHSHKSARAHKLLHTRAYMYTHTYTHTHTHTHVLRVVQSDEAC